MTKSEKFTKDFHSNNIRSKKNPLTTIVLTSTNHAKISLEFTFKYSEVTGIQSWEQ